MCTKKKKQMKMTTFFEQNKKKKTYRYTFAADAIHDAERWSKIGIPSLFQFVDFLTEMAICLI